MVSIENRIFIVITRFQVFAVENEFSRKEKSSNTTLSRRENSKRDYTQYLVILNLIIFEICYKNNNSSNINLQ